MANEGSGSGSVVLNVGGQLFQTFRSTLQNMPMLENLVNFPSERSSQEPVFIDRDPEVFKVLLNVARGYPASILKHLSPLQRRLVEEDAEYFQMGLSAKSEEFEFKLAQSSPDATISPDRTQYTIGRIGRDNSLFGDREIPQSGCVYWEVKLQKLTEQDRYEFVGVAQPSINLSKRWSQSGVWGWAFSRTGSYAIVDGNDAHGGALPIPKQGTVIGVSVDRDRGALSFWADGEFLATTTTDLKSKALFPHFSVWGTTVMQIRSGLAPPSVLHAEA